MMKKKKVLIISVFILLFIVVAGLVGVKISAKNKELDKIQKGIENTYKKLENNIKDYNNNREIISTELDDYYTDDLEGDYDGFIKILKEQKSIIDEVKTSTVELGNSCGNRLYPRSDINKICSNYQDYYETVFNVFINDYGEINKIIEDYNKTNNKGLEVYTAGEELDYLDYNKDGKYLGRD